MFKSKDKFTFILSKKLIFGTFENISRICSTNDLTRLLGILYVVITNFGNS